MDFNIPKHIPSHVSPKTLVAAKRLSDNAVSMHLYPGNLRWGQNGSGRGDYLFFLFTNKYGNLVVLYCTPYGYQMEFHVDDDNGVVHTEYSMVKNIRNLLFKLKRKGFTDCEHIKKFPTT